MSDEGEWVSAAEALRRIRARQGRTLHETNDLPHGVVHAQPADILSTGRDLYRVVRVMPNPRWLIVANMSSGVESRRKADDFEFEGLIAARGIGDPVTRGKRAARRARNAPPPEPVPIELTREWHDAERARVAWHMTLEDCAIGFGLLGAEYPMSGDARPHWLSTGLRPILRSLRR